MYLACIMKIAEGNKDDRWRQGSMRSFTNSGEIWNWALDVKGKERPKKEANKYRWVGGRFNKQENLCTRLVLDGRKMSRSPCSPARISKVYIEAVIGFSHVSSTDGLNNTLLSQGCVLENGFDCGNSGRNTHPKDRGGDEETPNALGQLTGQLAVTSSQLPPPTRRHPKYLF